MLDELFTVLGYLVASVAYFVVWSIIGVVAVVGFLPVVDSVAAALAVASVGVFVVFSGFVVCIPVLVPW